MLLIPSLAQSDAAKECEQNVSFLNSLCYPLYFFLAVVMRIHSPLDKLASFQSHCSCRRKQTNIKVCTANNPSFLLFRTHFYGALTCF